MTRKIFILLWILLTVYGSEAQPPLTIDSCMQWARANYPLVRQQQLIERSRDLSVENASRGQLPQLSLGGQATYQSDVTKIGISMPGFTLPELSKDQYKIYTEVNQPITDLHTIKRQKELLRSNGEVESQKLEVELYKLKDRVSQLFFGILLLNEQEKQVELMMGDIRLGMDKTKVAVENGVATKTNLYLLEAELVKARQRIREIGAMRESYLEMLSLFTGKKWEGTVRLQAPVIPLESQDSLEINRPELKLYDLQGRNLGLQEKLLNARNIPRLSLFVQGGVGRPALNMLSNELDPYYIGGIRLGWNIGNLYTQKADRKLIGLQQQTISLQRETFLLNTRVSLTQQDGEIRKYIGLISEDRELIGLREKIKQSSQLQLENGIITANDYVTYVNAEDQARQGLLLHEMQLIMARFGKELVKGL